MRTSPYRTTTQDRGTTVHPPTASEASQAVAVPRHPAGRGFAQTVGLQPAIAVTVFAVDSMVFAGDVASAGLLLPVSIGAAAALGVITFLGQRRWYGDDDEAALIKALIVAVLTAIPAPLPAFLSVPTGIIGLFGRKGR